MAGFDELLQRIARSLEEAGAQRPGDDLRARLGYGTGDEDEDEDELTSDAIREPETGGQPETARTAQTAWRPAASRTPLQASVTPRASETHRAPLVDSAFRGRISSRAAPPRPHASPASLLSERIRARLRTPDALREAFVVKEILDRPLGQRRGRQGIR